MRLRRAVAVGDFKSFKRVTVPPEPPTSSPSVRAPTAQRTTRNDPGASLGSVVCGQVVWGSREKVLGVVVDRVRVGEDRGR